MLNCYKIYIKNNLHYLLYILFIYYPLTLAKHDMWDGVIIEFASKIKNLSGLKAWFFESGWIFQYFQLKYFINIALYFNLNYKIINDLSILIFGLLFIKEVEYISLTIFKLSKNSTLFVLCLLSIFPTWSVLLSSVLTFYFLCLVLSLLSLRFLHSNHLVLNVFSIILLLIIYNYNSLLSFIPILSYLYDNNIDDKGFKKPSYKTVIILIFAILYYVYFKILHPPSGLYVGYNIIKLDKKFISIFLNSLYGYSTFLILPIFLLLFVKKLTYKQNKQLFYIFVLFTSSIIPYTLVGRYVDIFSFIDWDYRHAFLISLPICIFFGILFDSSKLYINIYKIFIYFLHLSLLLSGFFVKFNRKIFEEDLINVLKKQKIVFKNSNIQIIGDNLPLPHIRPYESNYLFYKLNNSQNNWTSISNKYNPNNNIPIYIINKHNYQLENVFIYEKINKKLIINIKVIGYKTKKDILLNFFNLNNNKSIVII